MIKKIVKSNTCWSLLSNGSTALLGFINIAFIARHFSVEDAGKWFMLLTIYTVFELLRSGWIQTPYIRFFVIAGNEVEKTRLTGAAWQLFLLITLLLSIVILPATFIEKFNISSFSLARKYTLYWLICALPYQILQWQLQARQLFKKLAIARVFFPLAFFALLVLQFQLKFGIETVVLFFGALQLVAAFLGLCLGWLHIGNWGSSLKAERRKLSGFGKYSMLTMVTASLLRSSDQLIIALWLGPTAVAIYAIPQKLIEVVEIPVRSFAALAITKATQLWQNQQLEELRSFFFKQCGLLTMLIIPIVAFLLLFPSVVVNLLGGAKYHQSSALLQIFCVYALLIPVDRYCGLLLDAGNRPKVNTIKVTCMLIANVGLDVLSLYLGFGLYGVAAGSTITFLLGVIIGWAQLRDILDVFTLKKFLRGSQQSVSSLKSILIA